MDYCKYHPLTPATYYCEYCDTNSCDHCCDDEKQKFRCFMCSKHLESLGAVNYATPFWRRLEESFRYPLTNQPLILMASVAVLSFIVSYLPLAFLWQLMIAGAFMKYCFNCLENTSNGAIKAPDITAAYGGGLTLMFQLFAILLIMGATVFGILRLLGPNAAGFIAIILIAGLPAVLIIFGMTEELSEALNPLNLLRLVSAIGLPYGLLLGLIIIMSASVGVISEVLGDGLTFISMTLQSMVSSYYTIVVFHIMGNMIFQYQGELGFTAREDDFEDKPARTDQQRLAAKIEVKLKEGDTESVLKLFPEGVKRFPNDSYFYKSYFDYLEATRNSDQLKEFASSYLDFLIRNKQEQLLRDLYNRILQVSPDYLPNSAVLRHKLAKACQDRGDYLAAIKLINGMHKQFPDYLHLLEAFEIMAESLESLPNKEKLAEQCRALMASIERTRPKVKKSASDTNHDIVNEESSDSVNSELEQAEKQDEQEKDLPPIEFKLD